MQAFFRGWCENILKLRSGDGCTTMNEHFKRVNFRVCELYLNKAAIFKTWLTNMSSKLIVIKHKWV